MGVLFGVVCWEGGEVIKFMRFCFAIQRPLLCCAFILSFEVLLLQLVVIIVSIGLLVLEAGRRPLKQGHGPSFLGTRGKKHKDILPLFRWWAQF